MSDDQEVQSAVVELKVYLDVPTTDCLEDRLELIRQYVRSFSPDEAKLRDVTLAGTETQEEAGERRMAEAESRHEAKLDERRERYFDNHGHY